MPALGSTSRLQLDLRGQSARPNRSFSSNGFGHVVKWPDHFRGQHNLIRMGASVRCHSEVGHGGNAHAPGGNGSMKLDQVRRHGAARCSTFEGGGFDETVRVVTAPMRPGSKGCAAALVISLRFLRAELRNCETRDRSRNGHVE